MRSGLCCLPQRNGPWMAFSPRTSSSSDIICGAGRSGYSAHGTHAAAACRIPAFVSCVTTPTSIWRSVAPEICHVWGRDAAELRPAGPLHPGGWVILRVLGLNQTSYSLNSASSCWKTVIRHGEQATMGNDETQITSSSFLGATIYWTRQYCVWPHQTRILCTTFRLLGTLALQAVTRGCCFCGHLRAEASRGGGCGPCGCRVGTVNVGPGKSTT